MKQSYIEATALALLSVCTSCTERQHEEVKTTRVILDCGRSAARAGDGADDLIWDINIFATGENGMTEEHLYAEFDTPAQGTVPMNLTLTGGRTYSVFAIANAGYGMDIGDKTGIENLRHHLPYPDAFDRGMPMSGRADGIMAEDKTVTISMERLVSKVTVYLDRSRLDKNVDFHIAGIKVGNCPRTVTPFLPSSATDPDDFFPSGYYVSGSDRADLYLLENLQGRLDNTLCSYMELQIDYSSGNLLTEAGSGLYYRFYLRENDGFNVRRNCHYNITVTPEGNGLLCDDSWRVDKSRLVTWDGEPYLKIFPEGTVVDGVFYKNYYEFERGESRHFDIAANPSRMDIWLREDLVEDESEDGRAYYTLDEDCKGFTVRAGEIPCLSMMEIHGGEPFNGYATIAVSVK